MPLCPACNKPMDARIYDDSENRYYWECRNMNPDGSICWNTEWEEDL